MSMNLNSICHIIVNTTLVATSALTPMTIIGSDNESVPTIHQCPHWVIILSSRLTNSNNNATLELHSHRTMATMKHATDNSINVDDNCSALDHADDEGTTVHKGK